MLFSLEQGVQGITKAVTELNVPTYLEGVVERLNKIEAGMQEIKRA